MAIITKTIDITVAISTAPGKLVHRDDLRCTDFEVSTLAVEWVLAIVTVTVVIMIVVVVASDVDDMTVVVGVAVQRDGDNHNDNRHYRRNQHRPM